MSWKRSWLVAGQRCRAAGHVVGKRQFQSSSRAAQMSSNTIRKFSLWTQGTAVGKRMDRLSVGVWFNDIV